MEINVYKGEWGLPSIDFDCLRILAYIKLTNANVKIKIHDNPFKSPNGFLPFLEDFDRNIKIGGYNKIVDYLGTKGYDCNSSNGPLDSGVSLATLSGGYMHYVFENLHPFFVYSLWGDPQNVECTRMLYAKRMKFPFNFYYPRKYIEKTNDMTETLFNFSLDDKLDNHDCGNMTVNAKKCLNWLSEKLNDNKFFLGNQSELDCMLYAYLSIILYHSLPSNSLSVHLKNCPNLVKYVENITKTYFVAEGCTTNGDNVPKPDSKTFYTGKEEDESLSTKRRRQALSGIFAFVAMSFYAVSNGLLNVSYYEDNFSNQMIEYDEDNTD